MHSRSDVDQVEEVAPDAPRSVRPRWRGTVLVCGKCLRRHEDGKAMRRALKDEIAALAAGGRKARLVKTACLGLCPRRAVVVASPATLAGDEVLVLRRPADVAAAGPKLLPGRFRLP